MRSALEYEHHRCTLVKESQSCLPVLSPHAGKLYKMARALRKGVIVSDWNGKSKDYFRSTTALSSEKRRQVYGCPSYVIHPYSALSVYVEIVMFFLWTYCYIADPLMVAFADVDELASAKEVLNLLVMLILLVHLAACFVTGYQITKTKEVILEPKRIVRKYLATYFLVDLLGSLPFYHVCLAIDLDVDELFFSLVRCTHLLRVFRLVTCMQYLKQV